MALVQTFDIGYGPFMQMQWNILRPEPALVQQIQQHLDCHPVLATVLANRHLISPDQIDMFINPSLNMLPSPMLLKDMDKAVQRLCTALKNDELILVIGDYDADGVTATAVMVEFLKAANALVDFHLPHRTREGYGFSPSHVMQLAVPQGVKLILTVDCGTSSHAAVDAAKRFGIDVIITDHHSIETDLPDALAVVNPKRPNQSDALADLAGVGVAFYLAIALRMALRDSGWWTTRPEPNLKALCDLVAIGTVADIVPLTGVNRILTKAGLDQINSGTRPGIQAALSASGVRRSTVTSDDIGFRLAPRLNAAGRMAHAIEAFNLLAASDLSAAEQKAELLNSLNSRRQSVENRIYQQIVTRIESGPGYLSKNAIVMADTGWHEGVLGIVAAKLASRYYRPVILISTQDGIGKGSGRSIPQIDLFSALSQCAPLLEKFGGHRAAAGLTVKTSEIDKLRKGFEAAVTDMLPEAGVQQQLTIDCELSFDHINPQLLDGLGTLEPYGAQNPAPVFMARDVHVTTAYIVGRQHRQMTLCQSSQSRPPIRGIQFNISPESSRVSFFDQLAFRLQWNRHKGPREIQLVIEGF
jgi:single-stranded-DNA-specific exonuclease